MHAGRRDGRSFGNWCLKEYDLINMRKSLTTNYSVDACRKTIIKGLVKLLPKGQWSRSAAHHKFSQEFKTHFADFDSSQSFMCADKFCLLTINELSPGQLKRQLPGWSSSVVVILREAKSNKRLLKMFFINQMTDQDDFYSSDDWPRCSRTGRAQWRWRQAPG